MKKLLFVILFSLFLTTNFYSQYTPKSNFQNSSNSKSNKKRVLVELFTSQSCFACPPAEKFLSKIYTNQPYANVELIALEFHVDYRDGFGRKDVLASPLFTQRQRIYERKFTTGKLFTPQMVVDGYIQFPGNNEKKAQKAIKRTLKNLKADIDLSIVGESLKIDISNVPKHEYVSVYLAIAEDGIITRKNNNVANVSVVRRLNGLGRIAPNEKSFEMEAAYQIEDNWKKENIKLVVFVQENSTRNILGVEQIKLASTNVDHKL